MTERPRTLWRIVGEEVGTCNCDWGCPCQFNALPTHGGCEGVAGYQISDGYFGDVRLEGVRFAEIYFFPGPVHEGNGTQQLIVDEGASQAQREAIQAIVSGKEGGLPFEIFAAVTPNVLDPVFAPITFECDRERRTAIVSISTMAEARAEPIKNPVTGEEHRARIVLPEGFEFKEAEMANAVSIQAHAGAPLAFEHTASYAQLNAFDWTNEK